MQKDKTLIPGVGKYKLDVKRKIKGNYIQKEKCNITDEPRFLGFTTPSHYNAIDTQVYKKRILYNKIIAPTEIEVARKKARKDDSPSPHHYKVEECISKTQFKTIKYSIENSPRVAFVDRISKRKKFIPGAGSYNIDKGIHHITLGARRGYK